MAGGLALAASAGWFVAQPVAAAAGEHHAAQDRAKRLKLDLRASQRGDRARGHLGLLGGETALL